MTPSLNPKPLTTADRGALYAAQRSERAAAPVHALDRTAAIDTRNAHQTMRHAASRFPRMAPAATGEDELS